MTANIFTQCRIRVNCIKSVTDPLDMYKQEVFPKHFCNESKTFRYCVNGVSMTVIRFALDDGVLEAEPNYFSAVGKKISEASRRMSCL